MRTALVVVQDAGCRETLLSTLGRSGVSARALAPTARDVVRAAKDADCDLVLVEDDPPDGPDALGFIRSCRDARIRGSLVVVGMHPDEERVRALLSAGATGFVTWSRGRLQSSPPDGPLASEPEPGATSPER